MAEVPEAFVEVTVSSTGGLRSLVSHRPQKALHKSAMQEDYRIKASLGGFPIHTSELLTRLDRGEVAWVPDLHSSDESTDEGPVKPTLKRWPKGGAWWDQYRSPTKYPSSDSSSSDDDQRSEVEDEKPQHGGHRLTILRRSILDSSRGNGSPSVKANESLNKALQPKRSPGSQAGKTKNNLTEAGHETTTKEKGAEEEQQVSCPTCGRFFKSKISLANHQRKHLKEKPCECSSCGKRFATQKMLISHQACHAEETDDSHPNRATRDLEVHPEVMLYKCPECKKCFMLKEHLLLHQRKRAREWSHKCSKSGNSFIQKEQLIRHQKLHLGRKNNTLPKKKVRGTDSPETTEKRPPPALSREITSLSDLGSTNCQEVQSSRYKCQFCGKCLRSISLLVDHERIHKEPRPYKCSLCQKSFHFKYYLKTHQRIHMKAAACRYCGKHLSTRVTLANHEMLHTGERPYKCHTCPESFIRKHRLLQHQKIHENKRQCENIKSLRRQKRANHLAELEGIHAGPNLYKDRIHKQSFTHKSYQKSHTEGKYNKCQYCGVYMKKAFLINHMKIHRKKKIYQCLKCWKSFYQKNHLVVHQRSHVREKHSACLDSEGKSPIKKTFLKPENPLTKNLPCCYCGKNFYNSYTLTRHERIHSAEKPFKCAVCDKGFIEKWSVKRHEKIHLKGSGLKQSSVSEVKRHRFLPRPFTCVVCGKGFKQTWNLKRHVKTHMKKRGLKQPVVSEGSHVFSNSMKGSQGKGCGGLPANTKPQAASKIAEDNFLEDTRKSETEAQVVFGKGSKMGASGGSEQRKMQDKVHVKLSRKSKRHRQQNYREIPASQAVQPDKMLREKDNVILHCKQDKHCIHQQNEPQKNSKKAHHRSCEMVHAGWQSRSQAMPRRKSKRKVHLAGQRVRSCFCQKEGSKMALRKISSNSRVCKKSQNSKDCRRVKACSLDPSIATVCSGLFKSIPKNCKLGSPCFPLQRTSHGESKMEVTDSATPGRLACSEQDGEPQEVLGKEPEDIAKSQGSKKCQAYNSSDQAEPHISPVVPRNDVEQNISRIQIADGLSNAGLQHVGTASVGQQMEAQPMSSGEPFSCSREEGGGCTEAPRKTITEPQSGAHQRETIAVQLQATEIQNKYTCRQCNKSFRSRENLFVHEKNHRETRPFPCIQCEKSFYTMQSLKTHLRIHTGEKPFKCTECDFRSNTSSALSHHQKTHSHWRPYSCQQCKKSFWFVHSLILHLGVHNAKEPHTCSDCGRRFARRNGLTLHRKSKHSLEAAE